jgi:DUF1680 family protein
LTIDFHFFGQKKSLEAAKRLADYLIDHWGARPNMEIAPKSHLALHNVAVGLELALLMLYQETNDMRYLNFVTKFLKLTEWDGRIQMGRWDLLEGHVYTHISLCLAQLRLIKSYPAMKKLLKSSSNVLDLILKKNGMLVTGECGDHECWHNTQEGSFQIGETCATAYLIRWLDQLVQIDAKSVYGDLMERIIYNGLFAAQSPDGRRVRYYTPLDGKRKYFGEESEFSQVNSYSDTYCCPNNYRRIIAELPSMIFYKFKRGIAINLYTPCEASIDLAPKLEVIIRQETEYPRSGRIVIHVDPSKTANFSLRLRIPRWCKEKSVLRINDRLAAGPIRSGGFHTINRTWHKGDIVQLDLPMSIRLVRGHFAQAGRVAILCGPQVYCASSNQVKEDPNVNLQQLVLYPASAKEPFIGDSIRPNSCQVRAWGPTEWYLRGFNQIDEEYKPGLVIELTEFPDPLGEITYFKVPYPSTDEYVDDELLSS